MEFITHGEVTQAVLNTQNVLIDQAYEYRSGWLSPLEINSWVLVHYVVGESVGMRYLYLGKVLEIMVSLFFYFRIYYLYEIYTHIYQL